MPKNINNQGYDYNGADNSRIVVRVIALVVFVALLIFAWHFYQSGYSWKQSAQYTQISAPQKS